MAHSDVPPDLVDVLQMIMWMMESMTIRMENVLGKSMRVIMVRIINPIIIIKMKG